MAAGNAVYKVIGVTETSVAIRDEFDPASPTKSVTNDAERVVAEVNKLHPGKRIFAVDTECDVAELVHDNGKFLRFVTFDEIQPV